MKKHQEVVTDEQWLECNKFNRDMYEEFITNSTQLSDKTLTSYKSNLKIWFNWVRENLDNKKQIDIKPREYIRFQNWRINSGMSSADIANKRSAISSLNNYITVYWADEYPMFHNFINKSIPKPEKSFVNEKEPPTKQELANIIQTLEESNRCNKKMLIAYLKFTFETGCRRAETRQILKSIVNTPITTKTAKIKDKDGNMVEKEVSYYITPKIRCKGKGKTGKIRQFKFTDYSMDALKECVAENEKRGLIDCEYLFCSKRNGVTNQICETAFNDWATNIFSVILGRRFHPHILREARATTSALEDGKDIEAIRSLLGHNSSETTKIYIIGNDEDEESDALFV